MHAQRAGGGRDITVVFAENALDMLPLQAVDRHRVFRHQAVEIRMLGQQRRQHVIRIGRFAEIVAGTALDRLHGGGDARIAGQDQHLHLGIQLEQLGQQHQPRITLHLEVQHGVIGNILLRQLQAFGCGTSDADLQPPPPHGPRHHASESGIVIDQQQMGLLFAVELHFIGHIYIPFTISRSGSGSNRAMRQTQLGQRPAIFVIVEFHRPAGTCHARLAEK